MIRVFEKRMVQWRGVYIVEDGMLGAVFGESGQEIVVWGPHLGFTRWRQ